MQDNELKQKDCPAEINQQDSLTNKQAEPPTPEAQCQEVKLLDVHSCEEDCSELDTIVWESENGEPKYRYLECQGNEILERVGQCHVCHRVFKEVYNYACTECHDVCHPLSFLKQEENTQWVWVLSFEYEVIENAYPPKVYLSEEDALQGLKNFCQQLNCPPPPDDNYLDSEYREKLYMETGHKFRFEEVPIIQSQNIRR